MARLVWGIDSRTEHLGWFCDCETGKIDIYVRDLLISDSDLEADREAWRHVLDRLRDAIAKSERREDDRARISGEHARMLVALIEEGTRGRLPVSWAERLPSYPVGWASYWNLSLPRKRRDRPSIASRQLRAVAYVAAAEQYGLDPDPMERMRNYLHINERKHWEDVFTKLKGDAGRYLESIIWSVRPSPAVYRFVAALNADPEDARRALLDMLELG